MSDLQEEIAAFEREAQSGKLFVPGQDVTADPAATQGGQPAAPATWQPNPQRIDRMAAPLGKVWAFGFDKIAEFMGLPESYEVHTPEGLRRVVTCRVSKDEQGNMGRELAKLLDAILPPSVTFEASTRAGTIFGCLGMIGFLAAMKFRGLTAARAELLELMEAQKEGKHGA